MDFATDQSSRSNLYTDKLYDIYNKLTDVKSSTYFDYGAEIIDKDPKFKVGDHDRKSK